MEYDAITVSMNPSIDKTVTVEHFTAGGLNRVKTVRFDSGGKGINVSKAIITYGMKQIATGMVGGYNGKLLLSMLKNEGILHDFLTVSGETRVNMKIHDMKTGRITEVNEPGPEVENNVLDLFYLKLRAYLKKTKILVLSGSLPAAMSRCFYPDCVKMGVEMGHKVILDADGDSFARGILSKPYAIKPNLGELEQYAGKPLDSIEKIKTEIVLLSKKGIKMILVSLGEKGSVFYYQDKTFKVNPIKINVASTVGAGDAMVAAMAYCIKMNFPPEKTAKITMAAGCLAAATEGTEMACWKDIQKAYKDVCIERL